MKTGTATRTLEHNVPGTTKKAQISGSAAMFDILYNRMYTEKEWAIFRELFSNAWDSHRRAGTLDTPVDIHLPTALEPWFAIRDYGVGLSPEAVQTLFMNYGESDKNTTNDEIGGFGLGSKTPYAYTDQFTVKSFWNGHCYIFQAYLLEDGCPSSTLVSSQATNESNGIEITVNVDSNRGREMFTRAYKRMHAYIPTRPRLNYEPEGLKDQEYEHVFDNPAIEGVQRVAITTRMNTFAQKDIRFILDIVPYGVNRSDFTGAYSETNFINSVLMNRRVDIWLDTGVLDVTAPRESISMDDANKRKAAELFEQSMNLLLEQVTEEARQCRTWYEWVPYLKLLPAGHMMPPNGIANLTDGRNGMRVPLSVFGGGGTAKKYYHPTSGRYKSAWTADLIDELTRELIDTATLYYRPKNQWPIKAFMDQTFSRWSNDVGPIIVFNDANPDTVRAKLKELGIPNELHEMPFIKKAPGQTKTYSPQQYPVNMWSKRPEGGWAQSLMGADRNLSEMEQVVTEDTLVIATECPTIWSTLADLLNTEGVRTRISKVLIADIPDRHTRVRRQLLAMSGYGIDDEHRPKGIPGVTVTGRTLQAFANFHSIDRYEPNVDKASLRHWCELFPLGKGRTPLHRFAQACSHLSKVTSPEWWTTKTDYTDTRRVYDFLRKTYPDRMPEAEASAKLTIDEAAKAMHDCREHLIKKHPELERLVAPRPYTTDRVVGQLIAEFVKYIPEE